MPSVDVHHADESVTLWHGDCLDVLRELADCSVDSIVTDPPYGLGFMGKAWDDLPPGVEWAAECLRVLKPGGHLLAFGGSRTWHRLAVAVEDAGFEIRDSIAWLYGSGFPKSLDVSKAIDKRGGNGHLADEIAAAIKDSRLTRGWTTGQADRHFCGGSTNWTWFEGRKGMCRPPTSETFARIVEEWPELASLADRVAEAEREVIGEAQWSNSANHFVPGEDHTQRVHLDITAPATPAAEQWQGWGTALKPAFEPVVVGRKPLVGTVAANVLAHGTGALNIDGCRVGDGEGRVSGGPRPARAATGGFNMSDAGNRPTGGRWPANVVLDESQAAALDEQSGTGTSRIAPGAPGRRPRGMGEVGERKGDPRPNGAQHADSGDWREQYPEFTKLIFGEGSLTQRGTDVGGASRFFYVAKAPKSERPVVDGVAHPTVKPLSLMRWLVRLVTPPGGVVLEPFAGSGTTVEACLLEGFQCIAIEREADYLPLIEARIARVAARPTPDLGLLAFLDGESA